MRTLKNGQPWKMRDGDAVAITCCDCELQHEMFIDIDKKRNTLSLKFYRDDFATTENRKEKGIVLYRRKQKVKKKEKTKKMILR